MFVLPALTLALMFNTVDAGEVNLETPEITKEDVWNYRKVRFHQMTEKMASKVPNFECHSLLNQSQELALWECKTPEGMYAALYVWQNDDWTVAPGVFSAD